MGKVFLNDESLSFHAEAYRKVAANIEYANIDNNIKTIMVTSSLANEGKTTTICHLANIMTDLNKKILLIDLDLRKPSVHKYYNLTNNEGLTDHLINKGNYSDYIDNISEGLDVFTSGRIPANPSEIINSKALKELIKEVSAHYDYIFIDTPPIALVSDPLTISTLTDAVILIVGYSQTEREIAKKSVESLRRVNANIIGSILNKYPITNKNKHYYKYY